VKTTLLATLLGERPPAAGTVRMGGAVTAEWFRQDLTQVPADRSIYDCIAGLRPQWGRGPIQNHLGCFGFSGDDVQRSTSVLSGGERSRTALAMLTLGMANLLVLDEPTNHLDVESIEALEDAIEVYDGTVVLVSHDRAFLRELSTRVWAFDGDRLEDYGGPFVDWEVHAAERAARRTAARQRDEAAARTALRDGARREVEARRGGEQAVRAARRQAEEREAEVHRLEARIEQLAAALGDVTMYDGTADAARRAGQLDRELAECRRALDLAMQRWNEAVESAAQAGRSE
jgi:ATP-binding cassette subfamily F protein 3